MNENSCHADDINNEYLNYSDKRICITYNKDFSEKERRNKLKKNEQDLCRKYPAFKKLNSEKRIETLISHVFPEGFTKKIYIRNLTFTNSSGRDIWVLGIRPEKIEGDWMSEIFPGNVSLIFEGHITGKEFVIDKIHETADTKRLNFEAEASVIPHNSVFRIGENFLFDVVEETESLTRYTGEKLDEWKEYLKWKEKLAKSQIFGCKYCKISYDKNKKRLIFWLITETKEEADEFKKYLGKDIEVFDNNYSLDRWHFEFADEISENTRRIRYNSLEIGKFRGIEDEFYLKENEDSFLEAAWDGMFSETDDINSLEKDESYKNIQNDYEDYEDYEDYDEDSEEDSEWKNYQNIQRNFDNPYIVKAVYDLSQTAQEKINKSDLNGEKLDKFIYEKIIKNYYKDGFLALSAVGEFTLIRRFANAIKDLEKDESVSPNLAMWLFNVKRARVPDKSCNIKIDKWFNKGIEKNKNQKRAVYKILSAPDLALIQGPPGTGKTTVIAEAVYQFVKRGMRVLIASQSNDAVDNALDRLADTPEIRAIRLGQKRKRKIKKEELENQKFSETSALKCYYSALSGQLSKKWLDTWSEMDKQGEGFDKDIRDAGLFKEDITELNGLLLNKTEKYNEEYKTYQDYKTQLKEADEKNIMLENDKIQFKIFKNICCGKNEDDFYFSEDLNSIIKEAIEQDIEDFRIKGIYAASLEIKNTNAYIPLLLKNIKEIKKAADKLKKSESVSAEKTGDIKLLERKMAEVKEEMLKAVIANNVEETQKCKEEYRNLSKIFDEVQGASSEIIMTDIQKSLFSEEMIQKIQKGDRKEIIKQLEEIVEQLEKTVKKSVQAGEEYLSKKCRTETEKIKEELLAAEGRCINAKEERQKVKEEIILKQQTLARLRKKYDIEETEPEEIIEKIKIKKMENENNIKIQESLRKSWGQTVKEFKDRLEDEEAFIYDMEFYQQTYINSCNVVGISCTDNMRNLSDKGYEDFDVVIIDEVSKATPPELLIPLMKAKKAVLVGDHRQLPPMFKENENSFKELIEDEENTPEELKELLSKENFKKFKKMVTSSLFKDYFENADSSIKHSLLVQYRMHTDIMDIINRFYEGKLTGGLSKDAEEMEKAHGLSVKAADGTSLIVPEKHAYWIDSSELPDGTPVYESFINKSTSACNVMEKHIIMELLIKIAEDYKNKGYSENNKKTIGIISFYQAQVNQLKDAYRKLKKQYDFSAVDVEINTVDRFQGKEKNIIITSLVRNNPKARASRHVVAFERINVAFSRAQELLIITGAKHMYQEAMVELPNMDTAGTRTVPVYRNIMDDLNRKACFKTSDKIISKEAAEKIIEEYKAYGGKI